MAYLVGLPFGMAIAIWQLALGLVVGAVVVVLAWPWIERGKLPARLSAWGCCVGN